MTKSKVLLLGEIKYAHEAWTYLSKQSTIVKSKSTNRKSFIAECQSDTFADVSVIYLSSTSITGPFDEELLSILPSSLKFICHNDADYSQINTKACTSREISVSNAPTSGNAATADLTILLLLSLLRSLPSLLEGVSTLGHDTAGKTLGILGLGGVGRQVASRANAFGMKACYWNPEKLDTEHEEGFEYVELERLLAESDVLSLHLTLDTSTRHILSTAQFKAMKKDMVIINTAHPDLIDPTALLTALEDRVSSIGIDAPKATIHPDLLAHKKVLFLPGVATGTVETQLKMEEWTIGNVRKAIEEGALVSIVPEQRDLEKKLIRK